MLALLSRSHDQAKKSPPITLARYLLARGSQKVHSFSTNADNKVTPNPLPIPAPFLCLRNRRKGGAWPSSACVVLPAVAVHRSKHNNIHQHWCSIESTGPSVRAQESS